jgi:hypothetical protein
LEMVQCRFASLYRGGRLGAIMKSWSGADRP